MRWEFRWAVRYRTASTGMSRKADTRKRMLRSEGRILEKLLDEPLAADDRRLVLDRLWVLAKMYLYWRDDAAAVPLFDRIACEESRLDRRAIVPLLRWPLGRDAARVAASGYRALRRVALRDQVAP